MSVCNNLSLVLSSTFNFAHSTSQRCHEKRLYSLKIPHPPQGCKYLTDIYSNCSCTTRSLHLTPQHYSEVTLITQSEWSTNYRYQLNTSHLISSHHYIHVLFCLHYIRHLISPSLYQAFVQTSFYQESYLHYTRNPILTSSHQAHYPNFIISGLLTNLHSIRKLISWLPTLYIPAFWYSCSWSLSQHKTLSTLVFLAIINISLYSTQHDTIFTHYSKPFWILSLLFTFLP